MTPLVVTGTDTDVGKTVVSAALVLGLGATYWKPVQSGLEDQTDTHTVQALTGCEALAETYRLQLPASPHLSAEAEGVEIDPDLLSLPKVDGPLLVEGAGGLMVPLNRQTFYLDLIARWQAPVVLVARTQLGTINHTTLSLMALRAANCPVVGVVFNGPAEPLVEDTIVQMADVTHLGRIGPLEDLARDSLRAAADGLDLDRIRSALA